MTIVAAILGYAIGSAPTAEALGRLWGLDLRREGSGNPGANNARRLGGLPLAALVLSVEMGKGALAVWLGMQLAGDHGAIAAGIGAVAGNVYNGWYGFQGGKGLGITAGVLIGCWPTIFLPIITVITLAALVTRSSGAAALAAIAGINLFAAIWAVEELPNAWGVAAGAELILLSVSLSLLLVRKHWHDAVRKLAPR